MRDETEQNIWARVSAKGGLTAENALLSERLDALITQEKNSAAACHQLAARLSGADSAALRRVTAQTEQRVRQLSTLYFLFTGRRMRIRSPQTVFYSMVCDALREECLLMLSLQRLYQTVAEESPAYADTLLPLSSRLQKNLQTVTEVLQRCL